MQATSVGSHGTTFGWRATVLLVAALACGWGLTRWLDRSGGQMYAGILHAHSTAVVAPESGRVQAIFAEAGCELEPGAPLVLIRLDDLEAQIAAARKEVQSLEQEFQQVQAQGEVDLAWRSRILETEIFQTKLKAAYFLQERLNSQVEDLAWQDYLENGPQFASAVSEPGLLMPLILEGDRSEGLRVQAMLKQSAAQSAADALTAQLELCEARLQVLDRLQAGLPEKVRSAVGVVSTERDLAEARAGLAALESRKQELTVTSPVFGMAGLYQKLAGDRVTAGESILEVFDRQRRFLTVLLPPSAALSLKPGSRVDLLFPDAARREGVVAEIQSQTQPPDPWRSEPGVYVRIDPTGKLWPPVPIGSRVQVRVGTGEG